ncbi:hypothetical protein BC832DRAFT_537786 [Gaertneriomyces semiglobifer]|nr:hypothetical protein BC832DRAFT_537786 [Gaertneriomyces semiglobifer]
MADEFQFDKLAQAAEINWDLDSEQTLCSEPITIFSQDNFEIFQRDQATPEILDAEDAFENTDYGVPFGSSNINRLVPDIDTERDERVVFDDEESSSSTASSFVDINYRSTNDIDFGNPVIKTEREAKNVGANDLPASAATGRHAAIPKVVQNPLRPMAPRGNSAKERNQLATPRERSASKGDRIRVMLIGRTDKVTAEDRAILESALGRVCPVEIIDAPSLSLGPADLYVFHMLTYRETFQSLMDGVLAEMPQLQKDARIQGHHVPRFLPIVTDASALHNGDLQSAKSLMDMAEIEYIHDGPSRRLYHLHDLASMSREGTLRLLQLKEPAGTLPLQQRLRLMVAKAIFPLLLISVLAACATAIWSQSVWKRPAVDVRSCGHDCHDMDKKGAVAKSVIQMKSEAGYHIWRAEQQARETALAAGTRTHSSDCAQASDQPTTIATAVLPSTDNAVMTEKFENAMGDARQVVWQMVSTTCKHVMSGCAHVYENMVTLIRRSLGYWSRSYWKLRDRMQAAVYG